MAANLLKQAFSTDLAKNLFPSNVFFKHSKDDSAFITNDQVNLPHAGTKPGTAVDRSSFPGTISKRTDSATAYKVSELSSDPTHLQYSEELVVNYAKRANILEDHKMSLEEQVADLIAYAWARGGDSENAWTIKPEVVRTTSTETRAVNIATVGATAPTGTRKRIAYKDVVAVQQLLNNQDIPMSGRYALITADQLGDLMLLEEFKSSDYNKMKPTTDEGMESFSWMGFTWFVRSRVNVFTTGATLRDGQTNTAATDCAGGLFWHKSAVRHAKGGAKVFIDEERAEYYGTLMSALCRYGAIGARKDGKGIVNLVDAN